MEQRFLTSAVGPGKQNLLGDVQLLQRLLNKQSFATRVRLMADGYFGPKTLRAILAFQKQVMAMNLPDGVVGANGITIRRLQDMNVARVLTPAPVQPVEGSKSSVLTEADYQQAAKILQSDVASIKTVAQVETGSRGPFDKQGRPTILFERHYFHRLTDGVYDKINPDISNKAQGGYGLFSEQYPKLERACKLDHDAGLESASWGAFQIMGANYKTAGYTSVDAFVAAMQHSVGDHLQAFVTLIANTPAWKRAFLAKDWAAFAAAYNGPGYKKNSYDTKLAAAYAQYSR